MTAGCALPSTPFAWQIAPPAISTDLITFNIANATSISLVASTTQPGAALYYDLLIYVTPRPESSPDDQVPINIDLPAAKSLNIQSKEGELKVGRVDITLQPGSTSVILYKLRWNYPVTPIEGGAQLAALEIRGAAWVNLLLCPLYWRPSVFSSAIVTGPDVSHIKIESSTLWIDASESPPNGFRTHIVRMGATTNCLIEFKQMLITVTGQNYALAYASNASFSDSPMSFSRYGDSFTGANCLHSSSSSHATFLSISTSNIFVTESSTSSMVSDLDLLCLDASSRSSPSAQLIILDSNLTNVAHTTADSDPMPPMSTSIWNSATFSTYISGPRWTLFDRYSITPSGIYFSTFLPSCSEIRRLVDLHLMADRHRCKS